MSQPIVFELDLPDGLASFRLPPGVDDRLQELLDRQDRGEELTPEQRREAEGLTEPKAPGESGRVELPHSSQLAHARDGARARTVRVLPARANGARKRRSTSTTSYRSKRVERRLLTTWRWRASPAHSEKRHVCEPSIRSPGRRSPTPALGTTSGTSTSVEKELGSTPGAAWHRKPRSAREPHPQFGTRLLEQALVPSRRPPSLRRPRAVRRSARLAFSRPATGRTGSAGPASSQPWYRTPATSEWPSPG